VRAVRQRILQLLATDLHRPIGASTDGVIVLTQVKAEANRATKRQRGAKHRERTSARVRRIMLMKELPLIAADQHQIIGLPEETEFATNGIVSRALLSTAHGRLILFGFAEGQELSEHTSTQHAVVQILSGECEFSLDGQWHALKAGALLHMPPNLRHAVRATKAFSMLLTLIQPAHEAKPGRGDGQC
jgi:quercetin dioxygenase-like cupin family protein